ncbi:hypothetical protein SAMN04515678_1269 [Roseivivax sediminis]|uniref:Uncharacterized protein n=2 Tax=Roseivivax sediminis TaxID=936889 RepID=A0A1I2EN89_9RHOB|nr:hypothetical protein SAMN04515678_1269 [Roseivivax sediminis]
MDALSDRELHDASHLTEDQLSLRYKLTPTDARQTVLRDRWLATPDVKLSDYRFEARFDWIEIGVSTNKPVVPVHDVQPKLKKALDDPIRGGVHVTSKLNRNKLEETRDLLILLHDPSRRRFEKIFNVLEQQFGVMGSEGWVQHEVWSWELAVDIYPKRTRARDDDDMIARRVQMSELIRKHVAPSPMLMTGMFLDPKDWMRSHDGVELMPQFAGSLGQRAQHLKDTHKLHLSAADPDNHRAAAIDNTVYIAAKYRVGKYRLQDKIRDKRKRGQRTPPLPVDERRTRIEITVGSHQDTGLEERYETGINTIDDIASYSFDTLRRDLFNFELPTLAKDETGHPAEEELAVFSKTGSLGLKLMAQGRRVIERAKGIRDGTGRLLLPVRQKAHNLRFEDLNCKIRDALKAVATTFEEG